MINLLWVELGYTHLESQSHVSLQHDSLSAHLEKRADTLLFLSN